MCCTGAPPTQPQEVRDFGVRDSFEEARDRTFEVHFKGKSIVFSGEFSACLNVSTILEEIALHTQVVT